MISVNFSSKLEAFFIAFKIYHHFTCIGSVKFRCDICIFLLFKQKILRAEYFAYVFAVLTVFNSKLRLLSSISIGKLFASNYMKGNDLHLLRLRRYSDE